MNLCTRACLCGINAVDNNDDSNDRDIRCNESAERRKIPKEYELGEKMRGRYQADKMRG